MTRLLKILCPAFVFHCACLPSITAADFPKDNNILSWTMAERDAGLRNIEHIPSVLSHPIKHGRFVHYLPQGKVIAIISDTTEIPFDIDKFFADQRAAGVMVLVDGSVRLERYGLGFGPHQHWSSFSVAKAFTSTLVGAAIEDGYIHDVNEQLTVYIPEFVGSAYDGVSIKQLLTMTSGVKWNENYADPNSDVARWNKVTPVPHEEAIVSYMKHLPREATPGTKWLYKTGESNLVGVLVMRATKQPLATYLAKKIWLPYGMGDDAAWDLDSSGREIGGCCVSVALADYARFGQFILDGGKINGKSILPAGWIAAATTAHAAVHQDHRGYGYQWWTFDDGSYSAMGLFGQSIWIDPKRHIVVAMNANFPSFVSAPLFEQRNIFYRSLQRAVDKERGRINQPLLQ